MTSRPHKKGKRNQSKSTKSRLANYIKKIYDFGQKISNFVTGEQGNNQVCEKQIKDKTIEAIRLICCTLSNLGKARFAYKHT